MSSIKSQIWRTKPLLIAYAVVVTTTLGLLVNRDAPAASVPAMTGAHEHAGEPELERPDTPLWMQFFRPSLPAARKMLSTALPALSMAKRQNEEPRHLLFLWTGREGERPQTLFQAALPFLRPQQQAAAPAAPTPPTQAVPPVTGVTDGPDRPPETGTPPANPGPEPSPPKTAAEPREEVVVLNGGLPLVGIYHTHDYEAYISEFPDVAVSTDQDLIQIASYDHSLPTIVDIGETLAHHLRDLGVTTVHAPFSHQELGYDYAYQSSRDTVKQILRQAPTVKVLLDLHRDGAIGLDSTTIVDGEPVARVRCVIGARDDQGQWEGNLAFCNAIMDRMEEANPGITLPTLTPQARYNQDMLPGAILLEVGNALNTYEEAERAVGYLAEALVDLLREGEYPH